ncbi:carbohydrate kinase family protein [Candidatus Saccharibacteria bacterium TM7i]|nr:carbohydrate kinase family protein [Candidatus Saccharibacteria bacterium TM7i]
MTHTANHPYILAIGDTFTDAFIKLNDDTAKVETDEAGKKWLSVEFGAKFPYDTVDIVEAVGPSPNAAVAFSRLGAQSGLMTYIGDDETGASTLEYLRDEKIKTDTVSVQPGAKSNYWYVLRYGADRTMLTKNEGYEYTWQEPEQVPDWVYLAQSGDAAWELHEQLLEYLEKHPETKLAFQPGTVHFTWGAEKLADVYRRSEIVILNREEAALVTGLPIDSLADLTNAFHAMGPKIVVITDGPDGAYASDGERLLQIPNYPDPADPVDRTGAGDAFASTIVTALALGESLDTALRWAPINSMNVVQHIGAQTGLLTREEIEGHLANAPEDYGVRHLS